jgi:hypothetical protein
VSHLETIVSVRNSTTGSLAAYASFTGSVDDMRSFQELDINIAGAPTAAPGTLWFEFSPDAIHWDVSVPVPVYDLYGPPVTLRVILPWFRVRYLNGPQALSEFRLTTVLHKTGAKQLSRFLNQPLSCAEPIQVVRAVIAGESPDESFQNVTVSGTALHVSLSGTSLTNPLPVSTQEPPLQWRYDIQESSTGSIYTGFAPLGSSTGSAVWNIKRTSLNSSGNPTDTRWAIGAVWSDRLNGNYS